VVLFCFFRCKTSLSSLHLSLDLLVLKVRLDMQCQSCYNNGIKRKEKAYNFVYSGVIQCIPIRYSKHLTSIIRWYEFKRWKGIPRYG